MNAPSDQPVTHVELNALREFFVTLVEGNDKRYEQRFIAQQEAIQAALLAQKEAVNAALVAADRAVVKAETASEKRFESVNEFRQTLSDQTATFIPRAEALALLTALSDRLDALRREVQDLRDYRYGEQGRVTATSTVSRDDQAQQNWRTMATISAIGLFVSLVGLALVLAHS